MNLKSLVSYNRVIANRLAPQLAKTPLSANAVTGLSLLSGMAAGASFAFGGRIGLLTGAFWLHLGFILDNCDGQVARIKGQSSEWGMWLDYWADLIVDLSLWWGLYGGTRGMRESGLDDLFFGAAVFASLGSLVNFVRVVSFRRYAPKPATLKAAVPAASKNKPAWREAWESLGDDGDPSLLVWVLALIGRPDVFLLLGTVYVNLLWMFGPKPPDEVE